FRPPRGKIGARITTGVHPARLSQIFIPNFSAGERMSRKSDLRDARRAAAAAAKVSQAPRLEALERSLDCIRAVAVAMSEEEKLRPAAAPIASAPTLAGNVIPLRPQRRNVLEGF